MTVSHCPFHPPYNSTSSATTLPLSLSPSATPPQGLCTCYCISLQSSSPQRYHDLFLYFLQLSYFFKCHLPLCHPTYNDISPTLFTVLFSSPVLWIYQLPLFIICSPPMEYIFHEHRKFCASCSLLHP